MATWKELLKYELENRGDKFEDLKMTLTDEELVKEFDDGYGGSEGVPFTAWSKKYVYFPVVYDGEEWVGSAPRTVCEEKTSHIGGE
jgi:hypothetical protein